MELGYGCEPTVLSVAQSGATRCPKDQARPLALGKDAQPIPMLNPGIKVPRSHLVSLCVHTSS